MIMMVTFAFMLSIVFRSTTLAVSLSYVAIFIGKNMTDFLLTKYSWAKYILFAHFDLTQYVDRIPVAEGMTLQFSLMMLFIYFLLFNVISYLAFAKRDIAV
ncbi:hypothetical protein [Caldalkalibacillus mannanilyticus]|uniref:hypothetical protein n=1 Tax=Caldalkalibacillus mannanilyticus TaxID=1418 RepID=UPI000687300B|nr:hypothetical protein [Caldalkalibacillus mannanilyticus]